ncbi:hypothetical protein [Aeromicrobium sp. REDSEA-S32_B7]|uniref:hypothetical protein n=1 Tax=Aeromicrobium sp. REDSEA-S32_B7 TaxID=1811526 RepID=UPI0029555283|nr:hypothetical protein [Aeromicrobium sp. REDSEA-S32_B7]
MEQSDVVVAQLVEAVPQVGVRCGRDGRRELVVTGPTVPRRGGQGGTALAVDAPDRAVVGVGDGGRARCERAGAEAARARSAQDDAPLARRRLGPVASVRGSLHLVHRHRLIPSLSTTVGG